MRFNSTITSVDTSNLEHFIQSYNEPYIAAFLPSTLPFSTDSLKTIIKSRTSAVDIGIIHFNYNTMDTNVMRQNFFSIRILSCMKIQALQPPVRRKYGTYHFTIDNDH